MLALKLPIISVKIRTTYYAKTRFPLPIAQFHPSIFSPDCNGILVDIRNTVHRSRLYIVITGVRPEENQRINRFHADP